MQRRKFLAILVFFVAMFGICLVIYMFGNSLNPSSQAKSDYLYKYMFDVSELKVGDEKIENTPRGPILIKAVSPENYEVILMLVRFANKNVSGCIIKLVSEQEKQYLPQNTKYAESCRGVYFDKDGNVLKGSEPSALPMQRLEWKFPGNSKGVIQLAT